MATFNYTKVVNNIVALEKVLVDGGFVLSGITHAKGENKLMVVTDPGETKNPTTLVNAFTDPADLDVSSDKPVATDGIPECAANGVATHALLIKKKDPYTGGDIITGSEQVRAIPSSMIAAVPGATINLANGQGTITLGPMTLVGEMTVRIVGVGNDMRQKAIKIRFI